MMSPRLASTGENTTRVYYHIVHALKMVVY